MHEMDKPDGWITIDLRDGAVEGEDAEEMEEGYVQIDSTRLRFPFLSSLTLSLMGLGSFFLGVQSAYSGVLTADSDHREPSEREGYACEGVEGLGTEVVSIEVSPLGLSLSLSLCNLLLTELVSIVVQSRYGSRSRRLPLLDD